MAELQLTAGFQDKQCKQKLNFSLCMADVGVGLPSSRAVAEFCCSELPFETLTRMTG